jgi:hypothetical protein
MYRHLAIKLLWAFICNLFSIGSIFITILQTRKKVRRENQEKDMLIIHYIRPNLLHNHINYNLLSIKTTSPFNEWTSIYLLQQAGILASVGTRKSSTFNINSQVYTSYPILNINMVCVQSSNLFILFALLPLYHNLILGLVCF